MPFIFKSIDRCKPFFNTYEEGKKNKFKWTIECQNAFKELKKQQAQLPVVSKPKAGETLTLYLVVSQKAISIVLTKEEGGTQHSVYYARALYNVETHYSPLEKLAYAIITASKKLRPYFLEHPIEVLANYPLR